MILQTPGKHRKYWPSVLLNVLLIAAELYGFYLTLPILHEQAVFYYTELSNFFALVIAVIYVIIAAACKSKGAQLPKWVRTLRYLATCCLMLTLVIVVSVLAPADSYSRLLLEGGSLYQHLACPVISIISFLFFETEPRLRFSRVFVSLIPTVLYGVVMVVLNILHVFVEPYPFLRVYEQSVLTSVLWSGVILIGALAISVLLWLVNHVLGKPKK